jgi:hypothetical protein
VRITTAKILRIPYLTFSTNNAMEFAEKYSLTCLVHGDKFICELRISIHRVPNRVFGAKSTDRTRTEPRFDLYYIQGRQPPLSE